jgi:hypothetical protein
LVGPYLIGVVLGIELSSIQTKAGCDELLTHGFVLDYGNQTSEFPPCSSHEMLRQHHDPELSRGCFPHNFGLGSLVHIRSSKSESSFKDALTCSFLDAALEILQSTSTFVAISLVDFSCSSSWAHLPNTSLLSTEFTLHAILRVNPSLVPHLGGSTWAQTTCNCFGVK